MNLRYKQFEEEASRQHFPDTNDLERCFGWAKYTHKEDSSSSEWRPAFIEKSKVSGGQYTGRWVFEPGPKPTDIAAAAAPPTFSGPGGPPPPPPKDNKEEFVELDRTKVLLAPRVPKFDDHVFPEHKQYLEQAQMLRASGKSDWEIETVLNKLLDDKWEEHKSQAQVQDDSQKWPRITVDIIRGYLQRQQELHAKATEKQVAAQYAKGGLFG